jgi:D-alanine--poly(phosphoribitol) ligase subunit 1
MSASLTDHLREMLARWETHPDNSAVRHAGTAVSYRELGEITAWYQQELTRAGAKKATLLLPSGADAYAAEIACAASGVCFSPVHLAQPPERQAKMIEGFAPDVVISTEVEHAANLIPSHIPIVGPGRSRSRPFLTSVDADAPVYVMFTSGSTGRPKGVRIHRRGLAQFLCWATAFYAVTPADVWAQYSHMGFDLSICDVFTALHGGACLIPFVGTHDRSLPARVISRERITVWHSVPTAFKFIKEAGELIPGRLDSLRLISFCGETLLPDLVEAIFQAAPRTEIANTYGPTETTVFCAACRFDQRHWADYCQGSLSIGRPFPGWDFYLDGPEGHQELVISGDFIGAGYEGTVDSGGYQQYRGRAAYRTGDYVRKAGDLYYFSGRRDRQIKIRGNRIELDEIDRALRIPGVLDTATIFADEKITSFIVLEPNVPLDAVRAAARKRLPEFAQPHNLQVLPALPKNANGKIDYGSLQFRPMP